MTGYFFDKDAKEAFPIPFQHWYELKKEYEEKAAKHFKECKYVNYNSWRRFNP
jgi:hypothetical protein